jgi:hypothetical protein
MTAVTAYATTSSNYLGADAGILVCDETGEIARENTGLSLDGEDGELDFDAADLMLAGLGYSRTSDWTWSGSQWAATAGPSHA